MRSCGLRALAGALITIALVGAVGCGSNDGGTGAGASSGSALYDDNAKPGVTSSAVTIGIIADQTGPTASTQVPSQHGAEAYYKMTNDAGGVAGRKLDVKTCDEKYTAEAGLACLKRFETQEPVFALSNSLNAGTVQVAAAPLVQRAKLPVVGPQSVQSDILKSGNPYIFHTMCDYSNQADVGVAYMADKTKVAKPKVGIIVLPVPGGADWKSSIRRDVEKAGGSVVADLSIEPTATNADAVVQRMLGKKPDWFTVQGSATTAVVILKSLAKFGATDLPGLGIFSQGGEAVFNAVPQSVGKNWSSVNCYTDPTVNPPGAAAMEQAAQKYGYGKEAKDVNFVNGWVGAMVTVAALKRAGNDLTRGTFIKSLESIKNFDTGGLSSPITFGRGARAGATQIRPYTFDYAAGHVVAVGDYSDWAKYVTNAYAKQ